MKKDSIKAVLRNNLKQVYTLLSRNQPFNSFNDFVPMAISINSNFLQFFVSHFNQHIQCYLEWEQHLYLYNSINRTAQLPMTVKKIYLKSWGKGVKKKNTHTGDFSVLFLSLALTQLFSPNFYLQINTLQTTTEQLVLLARIMFLIEK